MSDSFRAAPGSADQQEYSPWNETSFLKFLSSLLAGLDTTQRPFRVSCGFAVEQKQLISQLSLSIYSGVIPITW